MNEVSDKTTLKKEKKPKFQPQKISDAQIAEAMRQCGILGDNVSAIIATIYNLYKIKIDRATIYKRIAHSEELQQLKSEAIEKHLDYAEGNITRWVKEGDKSATFFYLKTRGKHRGWSERTEITGANGAPVKTENVTYDMSNFSVEDLMAIAKEAFKE